MITGEPSDDMVTIFGRPEFDRSPGWWERTWTSIKGAFDGLSFSWLGPVGQFLLWLLVIAVVVAIAVAVRRRWRARDRSRDNEPEPSDIVPISLDDLVDPTELAARRAQVERQRDFKQAVLLRYREAVLALMRLRLVSTEPGRTTGELRTDVAASMPAVAPAFDRASTIFEVAWYSRHDTTEDEFAELDALVHVVLESTEPRVPA